MIKESTEHNISNVYKYNNRTSKYKKQKLNFKEKDKSTITVRASSTSLKIDRTRKKISKSTEVLNTINQFELIDIIPPGNIRKNIFVKCINNCYQDKPYSVP